MTVVTQFVTADGTDTGALSDIRRVYVQDGKVISNRNATLPGLSQYDSVSGGFCSAQKVCGDVMQCTLPRNATLIAFDAPPPLAHKRSSSGTTTPSAATADSRRWAARSSGE
jgi:hypothetical protein